MPANQEHGPGMDAATRRELRRLADEIALLKKQARRDRRTGQGAYRSVEAGGHAVFDEDGTLRTVVGLQDDGTYTTVDVNAPPPPAPADPVLSTQPGVLAVTSYGLTVDGSDWPLDFARVEVHVGSVSGFPVGAGSKVAEWGRDGGSVTVALDAGTWFVVLVAVNTSGAVSPPSSEQSADVPPPATGSGGVATYATDQAPVGLDASDEGAIWYDTSDGNLPHRWDGAAWVPLTVGAGGIADDAIQTRHIGRNQVDPFSNVLAPAGGPFANLIHDPGFRDADFRADRLADADDPTWKFVENSRLIFNDHWTPGPHIIIKTAAEAGRTGEGYAAYANGLRPGDQLGVYTADCAPGLTPGATTLLKSGVEAWNATGSFTALVEWLDAVGGVIASETHAGSPSNYPAPDLAVTVPATPPASLRVTYTFGADLFTDPDGDGSPAPWYTDPANPSYYYDFWLYDLNLPSPYGSALAWGDWFAEVEIPGDPMVDGEDAASRFLPLTRPFPVDPGVVYTTVGSYQTVGDGAGGVCLRFYDAAGNVLDAGPTISRASTAGDPAAPSWKQAPFRGYIAPDGAVTAAAGLNPIGPGTVRTRLPQASVGGWLDRATEDQGYIGPRNIGFHATDANGLPVPLFRVDMNYDDQTADVRTTGTFTHTGLLYVGGQKVYLNGPYDVGLELGRNDGVASSPYIDFHSGAVAVDFDARIIAKGGNGSSSGGTLYFDAAALRNKVPFIITGETWHTIGAAGQPAFANGFSAESEPVQFRLDAAGNVTIRGRCHVGTSGRYAFVLPPGYRPTSTADGVAVVGTSQTPCVCRIDTNGEVHFWFSGVTWVGAPPPFSAL